MRLRHRPQRLAASARALLTACGLLAACGLWTACGDGSEGQGPDTDAATGDAMIRGDGAASDGGVRDATADGPTDGGSPDATPDAAGDAASDASLIELALCPPETQASDECMATLEEGEGAAGLCDGLDNDCDGRVDDGCDCTPGQTQRCFAGPPGRDGIGACARGIQVCEGFEFPAWGECVGGLVPSEEQCDGLDNDCNGCSDELESCTDVLDCPLPGDPRIGTAAPFSTHTLDADAFVDPKLVKSYRWKVEGTPCDRMHRALPGGANEYNGRLSYRVNGANTARPSVEVALSGEYAVRLEVELVNGEVSSCQFPLVVGAPGLRVELCWPESGPNSPGGKEVDLDLHLGRAGNTTEWNGPMDCFYGNDECDIFSATPNSHGLWGRLASPASACRGAVPENVRDFVTACPNPRLDLDSRDTLTERGGLAFPTENINSNLVANGQSFRVAVVNYDCDDKPDCSGRTAHPLVNVYCDTRLEGSFRLEDGPNDPNFGAGNSGDPVTGARDVWRVVDIASTKNAGALTCELTPILNDAGTGPRIETGPDAGTLPY